MRCPNVIAKLVISLAKPSRTLTASQRRRLQALQPMCTGVVSVMVWHVLRTWSVGVA